MSAPRIGGNNPYANLARTLESGPVEAPKTAAKSGAGEAMAATLQQDSFQDPVMQLLGQLGQSFSNAASGSTSTPTGPTGPATPAPVQQPVSNLTTDKRGFPKGTVGLNADGKVEIPGLGTFDAPQPGKTSKIKLDKKNKLHLKMNADGTVSVEVKKKK